MTKKYLKYENRLLEEYKKQTMNFELDKDGKIKRKANRKHRTFPYNSKSGSVNPLFEGHF